jgi:hypothetical protein
VKLLFVVAAIGITPRLTTTDSPLSSSRIMFMLLSCQAAGKRENEPSWRVYFISELGMINIENKGKNKGQSMLALWAVLLLTPLT